MRLSFRRAAAAALLAATSALPALPTAAVPPARAERPVEVTGTAVQAVEAPDTYRTAAAVIGGGADGRSLDRLYRAYFLRAPDAAGYAHWQQVLASGATLGQVSDSFASSTEFQQRYGALTNRDFVTLVYRNVLARTPDAAGHAHWTSTLDRGTPRGHVMIGFSDSQEYKTRTGLFTAGADSRSVERLYWAYFLRTPDSAGLAYWNDQRARGVSLAQISDGFAASSEFRRRYGSLSNGEFVTLVYRNVLGRAPDSSGFSHWTGILNRGGSRGGVMLGFSDSEEYKKVAGTVTPPPSSATPVPPDPMPTAPADSYAFMHAPDGVPVRWAPCAPVKVVVNYAGAPAGAASALAEALTKISAATRVDWVLEGTTTERAPTMDWTRGYEDPARYGDRYSPVLVSWASSWPDVPAVGVGGFASAGSKVVTGHVTLDPTWTPPSRAMLVNLLLHELAHVANLGHAPRNDQVMYASLRGYDAYQYGDRAGLARVGAWDTSCAAPTAYATFGVLDRPAPTWRVAEEPAAR